MSLKLTIENFEVIIAKNLIMWNKNYKNRKKEKIGMDKTNVYNMYDIFIRH